MVEIETHVFFSNEFVSELFMQLWYGKKFRKKQTEWPGRGNKFLHFRLISAYTRPMVRNQLPFSFLSWWLENYETSDVPLFYLAKFVRHCSGFEITFKCLHIFKYWPRRYLTLSSFTLCPPFFYLYLFHTLSAEVLFSTTFMFQPLNFIFILLKVMH